MTEQTEIQPTEIQLNVSDLGGNTETITVPGDILIKNLQLHIEKNTSFGPSNLMNNDGPLDDLSASLGDPGNLETKTFKNTIMYILKICKK